MLSLRWLLLIVGILSVAACAPGPPYCCYVQYPSNPATNNYLQREAPFGPGPSRLASPGPAPGFDPVPRQRPQPEVPATPLDRSDGMKGLDTTGPTEQSRGHQDKAQADNPPTESNAATAQLCVSRFESGWGKLSAYGAVVADNEQSATGILASAQSDRLRGANEDFSFVINQEACDTDPAMILASLTYLAEVFFFGDNDAAALQLLNEARKWAPTDKPWAMAPLLNALRDCPEPENTAALNELRLFYAVDLGGWSDTAAHQRALRHLWASIRSSTCSTLRNLDS